MRKLTTLLLLLPLLAPSMLRADEEDPPPVFEVSRARVLVSPGAPHALDAFLPSATSREPLAWPLPDGPLVVLGLPDTDPVARALADVFHLPAAPEDLRGGYDLWAWHDGARPLVFLFAADPAALYAARFEFDAHAPMGASNPDARSLDFARPNEEAGLLVQAGHRAERPRFRIRAWAPGREVSPGFETEAASVHANRVWLDAEALGRDLTTEAVRRLREHGCTPVIVIRTALGSRRPASAADAPALEAAARHWGRGLGVRHYALVFDAERGETGSDDRVPGQVEAAWTRHVARWLRRTGLEELIVVPRSHSDRLARELGPPPDLRGIPEALVAWSGPTEHAVEITRTQAERRAREAGVPVVLLDTWAAPFQSDSGATHVPSAPYGRAADLHEVLDGVVVLGARHAEAMLDGAWGHASEARFGASHLMRVLPVSGADAARFLTQSADALERQDREDLGLLTWMRPLAASLHETAAHIAEGTRAVTVPVVPAGVVLDGRIDEASWSYARALPLEHPDLRLLVLSDGRHLHVALRIRETPATQSQDPLVIRLHVPETGATWKTALASDTLAVAGEASDVPAEHVRSVLRRGTERTAAEIRFDRFALFGEALPTRRFGFAVHWGNERLWPAPDSPRETGLLVVTR